MLRSPSRTTVATLAKANRVRVGVRVRVWVGVRVGARVGVRVGARVTIAKTTS